MEGSIPESFSLVMRDDSMSSDFYKGDIVFFKRALEPIPGEFMLVVDGSGGAYVRKVRGKAGDNWSAVASNENYDPMDAKADALRVVALVRGYFRE